MLFSYFCGGPHPPASHRWSLWLTHLIFSHIKLVWNVLLEIMVRALWGILEQPTKPPGTGQTEGTSSKRRTEEVCVCLGDGQCVYILLSVSSRHFVKQPDGFHSHHSEFLDFLQSLLVIFCHHFSLPFHKFWLYFRPPANVCFPTVFSLTRPCRSPLFSPVRQHFLQSGVRSTEAADFLSFSWAVVKLMHITSPFQLILIHIIRFGDPQKWLISS